MPERLILSPLAHTWLLDLDGTILRHNGYLDPGGDRLLPGCLEFLQAIPAGDMIIFLTSRPESQALDTENFLVARKIRFDKIIYDLPLGERILFNDKKPSGLATCQAINLERDKGIALEIVVDEAL